jgi:4-oxalocrotonate tautomerase
MPHIVVKMIEGRTADLKTALADRLTQATMEELQLPADAISVAVVDVAQEEWAKVHDTEIVPRPETLFKRPGYGPLASKSAQTVQQEI